MESRGKHDPLLSRESLDEAAVAYAGSHDRGDPGMSPLLGDLSRLPPVLLHVGEDEIHEALDIIGLFLDDALARRS